MGSFRAWEPMVAQNAATWQYRAILLLTVTVIGAPLFALTKDAALDGNVWVLATAFMGLLSAGGSLLAAIVGGDHQMRWLAGASLQKLTVDYEKTVTRQEFDEQQENFNKAHEGSRFWLDLQGMGAILALVMLVISTALLVFG